MICPALTHTNLDLDWRSALAQWFVQDQIDCIARWHASCAAHARTSHAEEVVKLRDQLRGTTTIMASLRSEHAALQATHMAAMEEKARMEDAHTTVLRAQQQVQWEGLALTRTNLGLDWQAHAEALQGRGETNQGLEARVQELAEQLRGTVSLLATVKSEKAAAEEANEMLREDNMALEEALLSMQAANGTSPSRSPQRGAQSPQSGDDADEVLRLKDLLQAPIHAPNLDRDWRCND